MNDETKAALESLRREMADGDPDWWKRERLIFNHIDGEPARLAAAREEQREACVQAAKWVGWSIAASPHTNIDAVCSAVRAAPLDATPLADELRTLRDRCADFAEQMRGMYDEISTLREALERANEGVRYWTDLAQAEARDAAALRARVAELEREREGLLALAWPGEHRHPDQSYKAMHEELVTSLRKAEAQVSAARAWAKTALDHHEMYGEDESGAYALLRAMDEAAKEKL